MKAPAEDLTKEKALAELTIEQFMRELIAHQIEIGEELSDELYFSLANSKTGFKDFYNRFYTANDQQEINSKGFLPSKLAAWIADNVPYFILDKDGLLFVYNNGVYRPDERTDIMRVVIKTLLKPTERKEARIKEVYSHIEHRASKVRTYEECNTQPKYFICFKNGMYDAKNRCIVPHDPKYFCLNQIPHDYRPEDNPKGEITAAYLKHICPEADDRKMLLTYAGYMMTTNTRWQKFITIYGQPNSGKSTLIGFLSYILGEKNGSALSLANICNGSQNRFATFNLTGKLFNINADLRAGIIEDPDTIKQLTGEDTISVERKHGGTISTKIYARFMFSANDLPSVLARDDAFFRRVWVLHIDKPPDEIDLDLPEKLRKEVDYMLHLCVGALEMFYETGEKVDDLESKNSVKYRKEWQRKSDTVAAFLYDERPFPENRRLQPSALFSAYEKYCDDQDRTKLTRNNFYNALQTKGFTRVPLHGTYLFVCPDKWYFEKDFEETTENTPFD